jgi:hypothetical protein
MSASQSPVMRTKALQAAAALARYERHVRRLAATWLEIDFYLKVSREIDEIREICAPLLQLALPVAAVLTSHAELIHTLWRRSQPNGNATAEQATRVLEEHLACIDTLARRCLQLAEEFASRSSREEVTFSGWPRG